jgi:hypothetical protein
MAREMSLTARETDITLFQLRTADEVMTCGTFGEINPVVEIDGQPVGDGKPGPITQRRRLPRVSRPAGPAMPVAAPATCRSAAAGRSLAM